MSRRWNEHCGVKQRKRKQAKFRLEKALAMTTDETRRQEIQKLLANLDAAAQKKKKPREPARRGPRP